MIRILRLLLCSTRRGGGGTRGSRGDGRGDVARRGCVLGSAVAVIVPVLVPVLDQRQFVFVFTTLGLGDEL